MDLNDLLQNYQKDIEETDNVIKKYCRGKSPLIEEVSRYIVSSGGKRIRPLLVIICAKLINPKVDNYHNLCAALEMIHTATLLHDDVIDNSHLRRGKKTANAIWDNKAAILIGDFLFSLSFQLLVKTKSIYILDILSKASNQMADGEVSQLQNSNDLSISLDKYFEIIEGKTATLFASACSSGAVLADATKEQELALQDYGNNLGLIFQIVDDIIDYSTDTKKLGKGNGDDYFESKVTIPVIICYENSNESDKKEIAELFEKSYEKKADCKDLERLVEVLNKYDCFKKSYIVAKNYYQKAIKSLESLPDSGQKKDLIQIVDFAFNRVS